VSPFAGCNCLVRIDADVGASVCIDAYPIACAQRDAFAAQQEARIFHYTLQLREYVTSHEILAHTRDGIGLETMVLRRSRMSDQHRGAAMVERKVIVFSRPFAEILQARPAA
jgi:hypothetical protein